MGNVQDFVMGGSKQSSKSSNSSSASSDQFSRNQSYQGSQNNSNSNSSQGSFNGNQSYGTLSNALTPSLGYVNSAGAMIGALLGLPPSQVNPVQYTPPQILPQRGASGGGGHPGGSNTGPLGIPIPPGFTMNLPPGVGPTTHLPVAPGTTPPAGTPLPADSLRAHLLRQMGVA